MSVRLEQLVALWITATESIHAHGEGHGVNHLTSLPPKGVRETVIADRIKVAMKPERCALLSVRLWNRRNL